MRRRRWPLLLQADWTRFFATVPKTHRELRWWGCLLAANRRVFLLHAVLLGLAVIVCMPLQPEEGACSRDAEARAHSPRTPCRSHKE